MMFISPKKHFTSKETPKHGNSKEFKMGCIHTCMLSYFYLEKFGTAASAAHPWSLADQPLDLDLMGTIET